MNSTELILSTRRTEKLGGLYFTLRISYISLAACIAGHSYALGEIADKGRFLEDVPELDAAFSYISDTYQSPLDTDYTVRLRTMMGGNLLTVAGETELLLEYEALTPKVKSSRTDLLVALGRSPVPRPTVYLQSALFVFYKECLRAGVLPPLLDGTHLYRYRQALNLYHVRPHRLLNLFSLGETRTRYTAHFFGFTL